ncbi:hypothetical protein BDV93DRAFT_565347 [Ceratobasidium sp. AG-I]|nr:hypothetical protein BDV93DRAFT_565347 [Ceratobasidium sp. AG-I]
MAQIDSQVAQYLQGHLERNTAQEYHDAWVVLDADQNFLSLYIPNKTKKFSAGLPPASSTSQIKGRIGLNRDIQLHGELKFLIAYTEGSYFTINLSALAQGVSPLATVSTILSIIVKTLKHLREPAHQLSKMTRFTPRHSSLPSERLAPVVGTESGGGLSSVNARSDVRSPASPHVCALDYKLLKTRTPPHQVLESVLYAV